MELGHNVLVEDFLFYLLVLVTNKPQKSISTAIFVKRGLFIFIHPVLQGADRKKTCSTASDSGLSAAVPVARPCVVTFLKPGAVLLHGPLRFRGRDGERGGEATRARAAEPRVGSLATELRVQCKGHRGRRISTCSSPNVCVSLFDSFAVRAALLTSWLSASLESGRRVRIRHEHTFKQTQPCNSSPPAAMSAVTLTAADLHPCIHQWIYLQLSAFHTPPPLCFTSSLFTSILISHFLFFAASRSASVYSPLPLSFLVFICNYNPGAWSTWLHCRTNRVRNAWVLVCSICLHQFRFYSGHTNTHWQNFSFSFSLLKTKNAANK